MMIAHEKTIIEKSLDGPFAFFKALKEQIESLRVIERTLQGKKYLVNYEYTGSHDGLVTSTAANMSINDLCLKTWESPETLYTELTILRGSIFSLYILGDYDFSKEFTIKDIFWIKFLHNSILKPGQPILEGHDYECVRDANNRDFDSSIGYIPTYR